MLRRILLACGIISSLLYVAMNILIPPLFAGYHWPSQTVSELSAIDAPTRPLWVAWAMGYVVLFTLFGIGVLQSSANNKPLRIAGVLIIVYVIINLYWPPMHLRGNPPTITDTLHLVWAGITLLLMMGIMGFGAAALGKAFKVYTIITFLVFTGFGILISTEAPGIPANTPTPHIGIWERINIGAFMLWVIVFALALIKNRLPEK